MAEVFVVMQCTEYEGDTLLGVFSSEEAAMDFVEAQDETGLSDTVWLDIRKVELNKIYSDYSNVGEVI